MMAPLSRSKGSIFFRVARYGEWRHVGTSWNKLEQTWNRSDGESGTVMITLIIEAVDTSDRQENVFRVREKNRERTRISGKWHKTSLEHVEQ